MSFLLSFKEQKFGDNYSKASKVVSVRLDCHSKIPQNGWFKQQNGSGGWRSEIRVQTWLGYSKNSLVRALFLVCRWPPSCSALPGASHLKYISIFNQIAYIQMKIELVNWQIFGVGQPYHSTECLLSHSTHFLYCL